MSARKQKPRKAATRRGARHGAKADQTPIDGFLRPEADRLRSRITACVQDGIMVAMKTASALRTLMDIMEPKPIDPATELQDFMASAERKQALATARQNLDEAARVEREARVACEEDARRRFHEQFRPIQEAVEAEELVKHQQARNRHMIELEAWRARPIDVCTCGSCPIVDRPKIKAEPRHRPEAPRRLEADELRLLAWARFREAKQLELQNDASTAIHAPGSEHPLLDAMDSIRAELVARSVGLAPSITSVLKHKEEIEQKFRDLVAAMESVEALIRVARSEETLIPQAVAAKMIAAARKMKPGEPMSLDAKAQEMELMRRADRHEVHRVTVGATQSYPLREVIKLMVSASQQDSSKQKGPA